MDSDLTRVWLRTVALLIDAEKDRLTQLDLAIGDGDHGLNMHRGFSAVAAGLNAPEQASAGAGQILISAGTTLVSVVGGASGPLFGSSFRALGRALDTGAPDTTAPDTGTFASALAAARDSIQRLGAAERGDATLYDVYAAAADAFGRTAAEGAGFTASARAAADAAEDGMRATIPMRARKGRASYLGLRSVGHQDPGATSAALVFRALATAAEER
ncbi:dihydroxyacetone kinase subunit DhaL [Streptomyces sp. NBC_00388]|uniref:dihydroxyacetone kinase subunit DhaL n=1 Tax=Streptomyces sp. NBC_00388 TaxID=2975735 RepID=UPI002E2198CC